MFADKPNVHNGLLSMKSWVTVNVFSKVVGSFNNPSRFN